jgi:DNA-binding LacI/PurR family transcriptional regulator
MGRHAAERIFEMVEKDLEATEVEDMVLSPRLVIRASTGPPDPSRPYG